MRCVNPSAATVWPGSTCFLTASRSSRNSVTRVLCSITAAGSTGIVVFNRSCGLPASGGQRQGRTTTARSSCHGAAFYAHFQYDGVEVTAGDVVVAGQLLGRCGSSGTRLPHLHEGTTYTALACH
jgi:hypothetical protein